MYLAACVLVWAASLLGIFLFGFLFGRCARKLPIVDETLPWTLHWGQVVPPSGRDAAVPGQNQAGRSWPSNPHKGDEADERHAAVTLSCRCVGCPIRHGQDASARPQG